MRNALLVACTMLGACAANAAPLQPSPIHGDTPGHKCRTDGTDRFIGQTASRTNGALIKRVSNAAVLRWAPPYTMLTMDFRSDRVNVYFDEQKKITKINCS
jgi:Peptidase inhibitor I78 family